MSFLRRLTVPRLPQSPNEASGSKAPEIILTLHVPGYGVLWMNQPVVDPFSDSLRRTDLAGPSNLDVTLTGELEVDVPLSMGRKRCKTIRVSMRAELKLDMGPGRQNEEDILFDRTVEIAGGSEGVWLEPGSQK